MEKERIIIELTRKYFVLVWDEYIKVICSKEEQRKIESFYEEELSFCERKEKVAWFRSK